MQEMKTHAVYLEDGRRADRLVQEESNPETGEAKIVTEIWAEPKIEKKLTQRVVDYKRPVVYKREIENVDEATGNVLERRVETIEPEVRRELREHIQTEDSVAAMSTDDCNCYVTREDMEEAFTNGFMTIAKLMKENSGEPAVADEKVSAFSVMSEKYEPSGTFFNLGGFKANMTPMGTVLWGAIGILAAVFIYVAFLL